VLHILEKYIGKRSLDSMPAKNPRINVVLEDPLYKQVQFLARKDGVSMSAKVRELLKEIIETQEDIYLSEIALERETRWKDAEAIPHTEVWS
jgi:predicted DNA-binding protein